MKCANCQTLNPQGARFCLNCGTAFSSTCSNCGSDLPADARFCINCGQPVGAAGSPSMTPVETGRTPTTSVQQREDSRAALQRYIPKELLEKLEAARRGGLMEGERRVVSILFCDVKGSTAAARELDPEEWAEIMNGAFEQMIAPVFHYEGTLARLMGDGLLAFFGAPIAHEDDPQRAVLTGLEIVKAIHGFAGGVRQQWGIEFDVRVGINTGLVVVGAVGSDLRVEYTALGDAINLAARMEQTARAGTVQIAEATHKLVAPLFDFEPIEQLQVEGREAPVRAYRVLGPKAVPGSLRGIAGLQAPLIGREQQLEVLRSAAEELQRGSGQIVSVMGEAGLGKSRLIAEFRRELNGDRPSNLLWLEGSTHSYQSSTPFALFADLFNGFFALQPPDADKYRKIKERLASFFPEKGEEMAPFLATMLDVAATPEDAERVKYLEPPQMRSRLFAHIVHFVERLSTAQPVVIFLDDLHWADPTSLELLQALLPLTDHTLLMIVVALRPRRQEPGWHFHERAQRDFHHRYQALTLPALQEGQARDLVAALLEIEDLPETVRQRILQKAEGNPFYVEEIIRSLLDEGLVVKEDGHWQAVRDIVDISIPDTLVGVITARLDRLEEPARQALQAASVLGREFSAGVLGALMDRPDSLNDLLAELQRRRLIVEKNRIPQRTYLFKHVLSQEAAYNSILLSNRRELHRRAAESMMRSEPVQPAEIARHLLEARQPARALPYLVDAGDRASRAYATAEAIAFYKKALSLQTVAEEMAAVYRAYEGLGGALTFANRIPQAQETYQELLALSERYGDVSPQITALNRLAAIAALRLGDFPQAEKLLTRAENLMERHGEKSGVVETAILRCQMCTAQADFESVVNFMSEVVAIGREIGTKEQMALGLEHVASSLVYLTRFDEAEEKGRQALELNREIGDRAHEAWLLAMALPVCAIRRGDFQEASTMLREALNIASKIGATEPQIFASWILAEVARSQGHYEEALHYGNRALDLALPLEEFTPFMIVPPLGTVGTVYVEISPKFVDKVAEFHLHALRLLENPTGALTGGAAWAQLGFCALILGDLETAEEVLQKGLHYPTMFTLLERPRLLASSALLACIRNNLEEAVDLAMQGHAYAQERQMRHVLPFTALTLGQVQQMCGDTEACLEACRQAESEAMKLGMRPIVWQARATTADALVAAGRSEEAKAERDAARRMVQEIADLFVEEGFRQAFLHNATEQIDP